MFRRHPAKAKFNLDMLEKDLPNLFSQKRRWGNTMRSMYIITGVVAITCGVGAASWRAANEVGLRIQAATHLAAMAQLAAEEKAKAAESAQGVSEAAERFAGVELVLERNAREAAEQALDKAVSRTAQAARMLAEQKNMTKNLNENFPDAEITKQELILALAAQGTTNKAMESKLNDLEAVLLSLDEMVVKQITARRQMQGELDKARVQIQGLSSQLQQARIRGQAKAQASAAKRAAEINRREAASDRPQTVKRAALNGAPKQVEVLRSPN
jgi:hypothetical protein